MMTHDSRSLGASAATMAFVFFAACDGGPTRPTDFDFAGRVKYVEMHDQYIDVGLESFEQGQTVQRILWVLPSTFVSTRVQNETFWRTGDIHDIAVGSDISVKTDGFARRSNPPQFEAIWVEVVLPKPPGFGR
jgi:hypothetical protein